MTDIQKLKALAEACNPDWVVDTWWASCDEDNEAYAYGPLRPCWPDAAEAKADMRFIAAANPAAVLELIAERDAYRAALEGAGYRMLDNMVERGPEFARAIGAATATLTMGIQQERDQLKAENFDVHVTLQAAKGEIERLNAENESLRKALHSAEESMWKSEANMDVEAAEAQRVLSSLRKEWSHD